jgi:WXG100 family type VII secretion target
MPYGHFLPHTVEGIKHKQETSHPNPNAQIEANLLDAKGRYASAGTTLQDIKQDLDTIAAGLQSSWLGGGSQAYQDKQGQLTTTVQTASDVMQKGSIAIGQMHDAYIEADNQQREKQENMELYMGVLMLETTLIGIIGPLLEAADAAFAAVMEALDIGVDVSNVAEDVAGELALEGVETLSSLDEVSSVESGFSEGEDAFNLGENAPSVSDQTTEPPLSTINEENPGPLDNPTNAGEAPPETENVEPIQTENETPNVDEVPETPPKEPSKYDSGVDVSQDDKEFLGSLDENPLEGSTTGKNLDDFLPPEPQEVQVNMVFTDTPAGDDPIIFTDENGNFFVDGELVPPDNVPDDLAGFDPGQELNPPDDAVYDGHEFDDFEFDHEEFDPGQELNGPADDTVYDGHEFDDFDFNHEEFDPGQELNPSAEETSSSDGSTISTDAESSIEYNDGDIIMDDDIQFEMVTNRPTPNVPEEPYDPSIIDDANQPLGENDPVNTPVGEDPTNELTPLLEKAPEGKEALNTIKEHNLQVQTKIMGDGETPEYEPPGPNDAHGGTITVDANADAGEMTEQVVHEAAHGEWENTGMTSSTLDTEEEEYVNNSLENEANAYAKTYEFTKNSDITSSLPQEMQQAYDEGYQEGELNLFKNNPNATDEELEAAGKAGARKKLADLLKHAKPPKGGESYGDIFRKYWRGDHPDDGGVGPSVTK